jgi:hypothetical protein
VELQEFLLEALKVIASMVIPVVLLLRSRVDLDRYIASQRAKEMGMPVRSVMRRRWYHKLKGERERDD